MGREKRTSYVSDLRGESPPPVDRQAEHQHKRFVMYAAVVGVMTLVIALWVMVLPVQIQRVKANGAKAIFSSSEEQPTGPAAALQEWRTSVERTQRDIMNLSTDLETDITDEATAVETTPAEDVGAIPIDVERLKARLSADEELSPNPNPSETNPDAPAE